ncbi:MAG: hypothetical protein D6831_03510, partial [Aquificota bacterium]
ENNVQSISSSSEISHNLIGYTRLHGVFIYNIDGNSNLLIERNYVEHPSMGWEHENGIGLEAGTQNLMAKCNYIHNSCGVGIETWKSLGNHTIESNTVENTGLTGCAEHIGEHERVGIRLTSSGNIVTHNLVTGAGGSGILVAYDESKGFLPERNKISQNSIYNNAGISIDLLADNDYINIGDGVTPDNGQRNDAAGNKGLDYPVFTNVSLSNGNLTLEGYIGTASKKLKPVSGETWTIEIYKADDDGNNNGEIEEGDGKSAPHGEGKTYIASIQLSSSDFDSNGNFSKEVSVSSLSVGDLITAITIDNNNNTSEFSANYSVTSANKIYGFVFHDGFNPETDSYIRPNGQKDSYERWDDKQVPPTVYIKLCDNDGNVLQVTSVNQGDGSFSLTGVSNGNYILVEDADNDTGNCEPTELDGWISTTPNQVPITINDSSVNVNFGDFHGSSVKGYVFDDKGDGSTTSTQANNGIMDSVEKGIDGVEVKACKDINCQTVIDNVLTSTGGEYTLYIPYDSSYEGQTVYILEKDKTGYTSTGNTKGNTTSYKNPDNSTVEERNIIDFLNNAGNTYENYNFGDIRKLNIHPFQSYSVTAGSSLSIKHTVSSGSPGKVFVSIVSQNGWSYSVFNDSNCDGNPDGTPIQKSGNYYQLNSGNPISSDNDYCIVIKTVIPTNVQDGTKEKLTIEAFHDWINTDSATFDDNDSTVDTITVTTKTNGMLYLAKFVKNVTQNGEFTKRNEGKPCDILEYKIVFKNVGSKDIKQISINDNIPSGTEFLEDKYSGKDVFLKIGNNQYTGSINETPDTDGVVFTENAIKVNINTLSNKETIKPGEEGYILYQVRIKGDNCGL